MACSLCRSEQLAFPVPDVAREHLPDDRPGAALCTRCLAVEPVDDPPPERPVFSGSIPGFPDGEAGAIVACLFALVDSLALYRAEISALASEAERRGVDVLLLVDRLASTDGVEPYFDVSRRSRQLAQLLYE
ncbi:DUF6276 family protein [Salarchaeum sp. JOR-1]|uniref:DUF6276 family protein n=1 Tax=Salarchaeum sp. JOR-1 TaxID=2599399 RepID=UPI0011982BB8|nr:DUF6276 family protein [Salarchaeum sp. JOR-1]QDX40381.1 hypothetical protein FQU85_05515 [Salarchaeum sp. JOR-1]